MIAASAVLEVAVSPRPGGESDKLGNYYEGLWIIWQMLEVVAGRTDSIIIEAVGELGDGAEFLLRIGKRLEVHQLKRQIRDANEWTLGTLREKGVLKYAAQHAGMGREFCFVSMVPARTLDELAGRARRSSDVASFADDLTSNRKLDDGFKSLCDDPDFGSPLVAWQALRRIWTYWTDERLIRAHNSLMAEVFLEGLPSDAATLALGEIAITNLGRELDLAAFDEQLAEHGLRRIRDARRAAAIDHINIMLSTWSAGVEAELFEPAIPRAVSNSIVDALGGEDCRIVFAAGSAGSGKSAVLQQVVTHLHRQDWVVTAARLDRLEPFVLTAQLGERLDLSSSPVAVLATAAAERRCVLVIDQLDAISRASGRAPGAMDAVAALIREAAAFPKMRLVFACRKFDIDNDDRIRHIAHDQKTRRVEIPELTEDDVTLVLRHIDVDTASLTPQQWQLLRTPLNLKLFRDGSSHSEVPSFKTTKDLFDAFWERKITDVRARYGASIRFVEVVDALVDSLSSRQRLSAPISILDSDNLLPDALLLVSEHVLVRPGQQLAFFHESFFDYAFARRWMTRSVDLVTFLTSSEQELFRRTQVRQVLLHLRDAEPERFVMEVEKLLSTQKVRFHLKDVVLSLLRVVERPTGAEAQMVERLVARNPPYLHRLGQALRSLGWFTVLDTEGTLHDWLRAADPAVRSLAFFVLTEGIHEHPDRVTEILAPYLGEDGYPAQVVWLLRFADLSSSRPLFDSVLEMVGRGDHDANGMDLWMLARELPHRQPEWAIDLLDVWLTRHIEHAEDDGRIAALQAQERQAIKFCIASAEAAPVRFCMVIIPHMLRIIALTAYPREHLPYAAQHFSGWFPGSEPYEIDDGLIEAAILAVQAAVRQDTNAMLPVLQLLADDAHDAAQLLLYKGLAAAPQRLAERAGDILQQGDHRLECGYGGNSMWVTRELLLATSPFMPQQSFSAIELRVRDLRMPWERPPGRPVGIYAFTLLSGLDEERLSERGRRRLGELRRLFHAEQPTQPEAMQVSTIVSPILPSAAARMADTNWLQAMAKYDVDREDYVTRIGGVHELAAVLQSETAQNPGRFAKLALKLTPDHHPAYAQNLLLGLAAAPELADTAVVYDAIRHIASLRQPASERWLSWPLRRYLDDDIPADIIELMLDRALHAVEPTSDYWLQSTSSGNRRGIGDAIHNNGINVARGQAVEKLGDLLVRDADGRRTALVEPHLRQLAADPSVAVRSCTGHLISAALRHARPRAIEAFHVLIDTDDRLLATRTVERLVAYLMNGDGSSLTSPVVKRMLVSEHHDVRQTGGRLSAYLALAKGEDELLHQHRTSPDPATRTGIAEMTAGLLPRNLNVPLATDILTQLFNDTDENVQRTAANAASALRGEALRPFAEVLTQLIDSPTLAKAEAQLLITLDRAPDRVDTLIMHCAKRFIALHVDELDDISTAAAGDTQQVTELLLRAYAQSKDAQVRSETLDLLDQLLLLNAYGVQQGPGVLRNCPV